MTDAVVVVNHRSHALLATYLAATTDGLEATVVVVDNFSDDDERAAVSRLARERGWHLVTAPNDGFGAGVNRGVEAARALGASAFLVLNPDLTLTPAGARELLDLARADHDALVAPHVLRPDGSVWSQGGLLDRTTGRTRTRPELVGDEPDWLTGACLAVHVDLWDRVGGFSEDFFMYWEDIDLSVRVAAAGGHLLVAPTTAVHDVGGTQEHGGSRRKSDLYYRHNCRGRLVFAARNLEPELARRWVRSAPRYARDVVLRGGRRQLLRSPGPVLAALRGTLEGARFVRRGARRPAAERPLRVVVAHPSPDLYGSDRQLLESLRALTARGHRVTVVLPHEGPLVPLVVDAGAQVRIAGFPVLRKSELAPTRLPRLLWGSLTATLRAARRLRSDRPDVLYVNTVTIPVWAAAGRLAGVPTLTHVHEAEDGNRMVATALALPVLASRTVVANSAAAREALVRAVPRLARRTLVVHNGVAGPPDGPVDAPTDAERAPGAPWHLVSVGRLSPRKGTDVALEAVALLVAAGEDVRLSVAGTTFAGYEWFEDELRTRARQPDLAGRVELLGYVHPTWDLLASADVVLVPSRAEPFGNTAVEALLARRPLVASDVQGLAEVVRDGTTGLLVPPGDAHALADAVAALLHDEQRRRTLASTGEDDAHERFSLRRYADDVVAAVTGTAGDATNRASTPGSTTATTPVGDPASTPKFTRTPDGELEPFV